MALGITQSEVTIVRHEYRMQSPATQKDIGLSMHWATQAMEKAGLNADYDNAVMVEARDDQVIVYWIEEK
jgi:hypothetical protein